MARKKKKSAKSVKSVKRKAIGIPELNGYSLGQSIYCLRYPDKILIRGSIYAIFKTKTHEFVELVDDITGQFRAALIEDIIENPTRKQINSANSKIAFKMRKLKDKK